MDDFTCTPAISTGGELVVASAMPLLSSALVVRSPSVGRTSLVLDGHRGCVVFVRAGLLAQPRLQGSLTGSAGPSRGDSRRLDCTMSATDPEHVISPDDDGGPHRPAAHSWRWYWRPLLTLVIATVTAMVLLFVPR